MCISNDPSWKACCFARISCSCPIFLLTAWWGDDSRDIIIIIIIIIKFPGNWFKNPIASKYGIFFLHGLTGWFFKVNVNVVKYIYLYIYINHGCYGICWIWVGGLYLPPNRPFGRGRTPGISGTYDHHSYYLYLLNGMILQVVVSPCVFPHYQWTSAPVPSLENVSGLVDCAKALAFWSFCWFVSEGVHYDDIPKRKGVFQPLFL